MLNVSARIKMQTVRLLLHTAVRWLSKGNYLIFFDFFIDKPEMKQLLTVDGKSFVIYLADIFDKLNILNWQLQRSNLTLIDSKTKIFGFITYLELYQKNISTRTFT